MVQDFSLNQYIANDIQAANEIISCEVFFAFVKKVCYFEPLWKKCYLNAFTGKYLRTFELCILEEYCLVIIWLCLIMVSLRSGDVVYCSNTRPAPWHAACVFNDTHILVSCCHVATDRFSVHWIPWNVQIFNISECSSELNRKYRHSKNWQRPIHNIIITRLLSIATNSIIYYILLVHNIATCFGH
jgi:hypothetical protein